MLLATGVLAAACGSGSAPARYESGRAGSVPACTATAVRAVERHVTLAALPGPCGGLRRAQLNLALGRAIYEVAGAGQHKAAWRRRAAAAEGRLTRLIKSLPRPAVHPRPVPPPPPAAPAGRWGPGLATLAAWLCTMSLGALMLVPWIRRRGLHPPRAARRPPGPVVPLGHAGRGRRRAAGLDRLSGHRLEQPGLAGDRHPARGHWARHGHADRVDGPGVRAGSRSSTSRLTLTGARSSGSRRPGRDLRPAAPDLAGSADHHPRRARPGRQRDDPAGPAHGGDRAVNCWEWPAGRWPNSLQA